MIIEMKELTEKEMAKTDETFQKEYKFLNKNKCQNKNGCGMFKDDNDGKPKYWSIRTVIRNLLALGLVYMVYRETGPWTAFVAFLLFAATESQYFMNQMVISSLKSTSRALESIKHSMQNKKEILDKVDAIITKLKRKGGAE